MKKDFLTNDIRQLIITPEHWRVILPGEISDVPENKKDAFPKHFQLHPHREIMLSLAGTCTYCFDRKLYQCAPGTLFLINHNVEHEYLHNSKTEKMLHLWTYVLKDRSVVVRCVAINREKNQVLSSAILPPISGLDLEYFWDRLDEASTKQERAHWLQFFKLAMALRFGQFLESAGLARDQYHQLVVQAALERIRVNLINGINVAQLAKNSGYTRFHFARIFREITGGTIQNYIDQCRLKELERLQKLNLLQKEIAARLGFKNTRSYYKWRNKHLPNKVGSEGLL
jgi:AraC-like DNA-binding protein